MKRYSQSKKPNMIEDINGDYVKVSDVVQFLRLIRMQPHHTQKSELVAKLYSELERRQK